MTTRIYITKFALKQGIVPADAEVEPNGIATVQGAFPWLVQRFSKTDYALTNEDAREKARKLAINKANKLEREAGELRGLFQEQEA